MRHRCPPLWLLRDIPALAAMMASLWALIWQMLAVAFMAERRKRPASANEIALVYGLLARAEDALDFALMRQAHRLAGFDPRLIARTFYEAPTDLAAFNARFARYIHGLLNLDAVARMAADELRRRCRIGRTARVSTVTPARAASRRVACFSRIATGGGVMRAPARLTEGGVATRPNARGPPHTIADCRLPR